MGLIARLFRKRAARKRSIFAYHDGQSHRWIDPMLVEERMEKAGGEGWQQVVIDVRNLHRPTPPGVSGVVLAERAAARRREKGKLLAWVREAFGILPLSADGKGLTEAETVGVLTDYLEFCGGLAAAARPLAASPAATADSPAG